MTPPDLSHDELVFLDALDRLPSEPPELLPLAEHAVRAGTRLRRRRRIATAVAALGVVAVASSGAALAGDRHDGRGSRPGFAAAPTATATSPSVRTGPAPRPSTPGHPSRSAAAGYPAGSVAYLDDPAWTLGPGQTSADDKLYYSDGRGGGLSLNWRPAADYGSKYTAGTPVRQITMGDAPATIYSLGGGYTITGVVRDGSFLTLDVPAGYDVAQLADLASHVHRV